MGQPDRNIVWCDCGAEAVALEAGEWGIEMAMLYYGRREKRGWIDRLRFAWRSLKDDIYLDQVILDPDAAVQLSNRLQESAIKARRLFKNPMEKE